MTKLDSGDLQGNVLVAHDLQKRYPGTTVLQGLSFTLQAGRILGFLGPNGAGKTTAIRILTTIIEPTAGSFSIRGISSDNPNKIRQVIGVLPESNGAPEGMAGLDYLIYQGQLYGFSKSDAKIRGLALLDEVGLTGKGGSLISTYSRGMRQRLGIARALVNDPSVVFLDEPTLGLDPSGQQELNTLIRKIARDRETAVVFCSHLLDEVEQLCDDVIILRAGQVVATGTVADVISSSGLGVIRLLVEPHQLEKAKKLLGELPIITKIQGVSGTNDWLEITTACADGVTESTYDYAVNNEVLQKLLQDKITVVSFETGGGRLQDVFLKLTSKDSKK